MLWKQVLRKNWPLHYMYIQQLKRFLDFHVILSCLGKFIITRLQGETGYRDTSEGKEGIGLVDMLMEVKLPYEKSMLLSKYFGTDSKFELLHIHNSHYEELDGEIYFGHSRSSWLYLR